MDERVVIWTQRAVDSLDKFCAYIAEDSPSAAKIVKDEIVHTASLLAKNPEMFQLDEYFKGDELNIRRFFKWSYKVVYQVLETEVVVLNVYHTKAL